MARDFGRGDAVRWNLGAEITGSAAGDAPGCVISQENGGGGVTKSGSGLERA